VAEGGVKDARGKENIATDYIASGQALLVLDTINLYKEATMNIFLFLVMFVLMLGGLSLAVAKSSDEVRINVPSRQRQLFLDDESVAKMVNLKRSMHTPDKKGAVIRGPQIRSAPVWDAGKKMYVLTTLRGNYESRDGLHWVFSGPTKPFRMDCIVGDFHDPAFPYKGLAPDNGGVVPAVSSDGLTFKKVAPLITSGDEYNLSFDEEDHLFLATVKQYGTFGRAVGLATSKDFKQWTKPELVFQADETDQKLGRKYIRECFANSMRQHPAYNQPSDYNIDVYNMGIFRYEGIYVGMPAMFHHTGKVPKNWKGFDKMNLTPQNLEFARQQGDYTGFHHIQLTCSRDLRRWIRLGDRKPFIDLSPLQAGAYDIQTNMPPSSPVVRGDELWFYYTGAKHYENIHTFDSDPVGVCLAVLRRDGFVSLDAGEKEGWVLTKPFVWPKGNLHLNVDATGGQAVVQIGDERGKPLTGFEDSKPVTGNHPDTAVDWPKGEVKKLAGRKVSLRIKLVHAQLYSYWIQ
jgi:hypothetical protein